MNVTFTAEEAFITYELLKSKSLTSTPSESHVYKHASEKLREVIIDTLQSSIERTNAELFTVWEDDMSNRIQRLDKENRDVSNSMKRRRDRRPTL